MDKMESLFSAVKGRTIAIVYIFENENAKGYSHYDIWKSDVITTWLNAVQELKCVPFILDARTFVYKAMNNSLPSIDYVINLNNGNIDLSTLGLIPSVCSFLSIPCIPCNTISIIVGENKLLSNLIAYSKKMNVPKELDKTDLTGITRPYNLGSSRGVKRGYIQQTDSFYQEFVRGIDITTPILFNPIEKRLEVLPTIMYYPIKQNIDWFLNEEEKETHEGYEKRIIHIDNTAKDRFLHLAESISINTYCRIDSRVKCDSFDDVKKIIKDQIISHEKIYFVEINPMPTIRNEINFHTALQELTSNYDMSVCVDNYREMVEDFSYTGFILFCSILACSKATH